MMREIIKLMKISVSLFLLLQISSSIFSQEIRVRVLSNQASAEISSQDTISIIDNMRGGLVYRGTNTESCLFTPDSSGIKMTRIEEGNTPIPLSLPFEIAIKIEIDTGKISLNRKKYRGYLILKKNDLGGNKSFIDVINILDVEDYIRGTIKYEISPFWPEETIKAHIVSARTYALFQTKNRKNRDFDLESTVLSQVYGGCSGEDTYANLLVEKTKGEHLVYGGNLIEGFYHACCGGYTEDVSDVWGINRPYLKIRKCPFCKDSPHFYWERKFSFSQIQNALKIYGFHTGNIIQVSIIRRSDTGRVLNLEIKSREGRLCISGADLRRFIGYDILPSTLFTIYRRGKEELIFTGRGWGHGVGMCQWGARGMALLRYDYKEILKFYYPGTEIKKLTTD